MKRRVHELTGLKLQRAPHGQQDHLDEVLAEAPHLVDSVLGAGDAERAAEQSVAEACTSRAGQHREVDGQKGEEAAVLCTAKV